MEEHQKKLKTKRGIKNVLPYERLKKEQMTSVVWTTPLGLPIVQPYRKTNRKQIMTSLQTVYISDPNSPAEGRAPHKTSCGVELLMHFPSELHETSLCVPSQFHS